MKSMSKLAIVAACLSLTTAAVGQAAEILSPSDFIISIDTDPFASASDYPDAESPLEAGDGLATTKYLNFGELNTGFIVEPFIGATTIQSMLLTTANDAEDRDPASWQIHGTNDGITSVDNGTGDAENWSLIAEGTVTLPAARETVHTPISFSNSTSYSAYRVTFPTVKNAAGANSMQIAEVGLYESNDATGTSVWDDFDFPIAFQLPSPTGVYNGGEGPASLLDGTGGTGVSQSASPAAEEADKIVDNSVQKYLNFGKENSGFIVEPALGPTTIQSFKFFTANDAEERDPTSYELYGTNDPITSTAHSLGDQENWTLIDSGALAFPVARDSFTPVTVVSNSTAYNAYRMIFPTVKDEVGGVETIANSMQIGEAFFFEDAIGAGINDFLASTDLALPIDTDEFTGLDTKFLNLGGQNGGFIVTPAKGESTINEFQVTTANDFDGRDPATWELYGTNDEIASVDTERGDGENWTLIDSGTFNDLQVPLDRIATGEVVPVNNSTPYASYRLIFPTIRDINQEGAGDAVQLTGIDFFGDVAEPIGTNGADFLEVQRNNPAGIPAWEAAFGLNSATVAGAAVPEPATAVLMLFGVIATSAKGRGRRSR